MRWWKPNLFLELREGKFFNNPMTIPKCLRNALLASKIEISECKWWYSIWPEDGEGYDDAHFKTH
jgi:hypothetical protein